ncbi:MAG: transcription factor S [Thermosphaera sp.]|nr:transcription factor S [Thermosphaera sp.]
MVKLCPRCGGVMKPIREGGKAILVCTRCGYREESSSTHSMKISNRIVHSAREKTIVIEREGDLAKLPITREVTCPKCGNHEAYYWVLQTRAADEPPTRFYKCTKCGHVWREYE